MANLKYDPDYSVLITIFFQFTYTVRCFRYALRFLLVPPRVRASQAEDHSFTLQSVRHSGEASATGLTTYEGCSSAHRAVVSPRPPCGSQISQNLRGLLHQELPLVIRHSLCSCSAQNIA